MPPSPLKTPELLDKEFLELRAKIIEIAAALDRLDRAPGTAEGDRRLKLLARAIAALAGPDADRAERIQLIFSFPYDPDWRKTLG